ncbi:MAG: GNAT family N-acetyltransferase [Acidobacteriaceae bacterium]|nr:GNAT family N-acetyltransferase [Acidobacteriaceae bacterium]MBV9780377.1 GNAT family N-acetyltransferase [Acidobacteriaceae bacterium]
MRAEPHDTPLILQFVRKLAEFERLSDQVIVNEDTLREGLFGAGSAAEAILAYFGSAPAAFAVYFHTFSTFSGYTGIYLEDLFVEPNYRGRGVGKSILVYLAKLAKQRGRGRLSWAVLDWNEPAIRFYRNLGAVPLGDWTVFELTGPALDRLAQAEVGIA